MTKTAEAKHLDTNTDLNGAQQLGTKMRNAVMVLAAALSLIGLYFLSRYNYLLFHSLAEVFSIVIIFAIFAIAWNSRRIMDNDFLLFIGIAFLFVGGLDLLHTVAYKGMGVLLENSSNPATQLWIAMRYMTAFSLLAASLFFVRRKIRPIFVFAVYSVATALLLGSIFYWGNFPQAYVDGVGLTAFKILSEYVISLILFGSILLLIVKRREFNGDVFKYLVAAIVVAIATELAFTLYTDVYGISNMVGHLLNVVSFYLIYKALVETGIKKPHDLLFRNLKQNEINLSRHTTELTEINNELVKEAAERKKVQDELRSSEQRWATTLASIGDAVIATDLSGKITFMNAVAENLTGWPFSEASQKPVMEVFHIVNEQTHLEVEDPVSKVLKTGLLAGLANHTVLVRKDKSEVAVDDSGAPIKDKDGNTVGVVLVFRDITERKKAERALQESEERLRLKLDSVLSPNMEIGEQELSNIIDVQALQSMMNDLFSVTQIGFTVADLRGNIFVGTGWQDICTNFHRVNPKTLKNCLESDLNLSSGVKQGEFRAYKCKNGLWDIVTPIIIGGKHVGNVFSGQFFFKNEKVVRDTFAAKAEKYGFDKDAYLAAFDNVPRWSREKVEDLMVFYTKLAEMISKLSYSNLKLAKSLSIEKVLQSELEQYSKHLETLVEEKTKQLRDQEKLAAIGQTAGMVGHDIRNPLQAITSELYLEKTELSSLPDGEAKKNLQEGIRSIEENLLYINKIIADLQDFARPLSPKKEEVHVEIAAKEALAMVTVPSNVNVNISSEADLPLLTADTTMLKRVLVNLMQNAVQAMPNGGNLTVNVICKDRYVIVNVEDTGEGIAEDAKSKLFTPLFTTKSKGQGFGLAVVKRLVEAQGGSITFESELSKGTKFSLQFPV